MRMTIHNAQRRFKPTRPRSSGWRSRLGVLAQARLPNEPPWKEEVTLHLLDDAGIAPVNAAIMSHDGATDVITQRYEPCPGEPAGLIGELFVNVERAAGCRAPRRLVRGPRARALSGARLRPPDRRRRRHARGARPHAAARADLTEATSIDTPVSNR